MASNRPVCLNNSPPGCLQSRGVQAAWLDDFTWWLDRNSGLTWLDCDLTWNKFFPLTWLETWLDLKKTGLNTYRGVKAGLTWWLDLMTWLNSDLTWLDHDLTWQNFWALDLTWGLTWLEKYDLNTPSLEGSASDWIWLEINITERTELYLKTNFRKRSLD